MNWSKGKNRLIILFLSINILLGWVNYRKALGSYFLKEIQIQDIKKVMLENNIIIESTIPRKYKPLQKLTVFPYQIDSAERETIVKRIFATVEDVKISLQSAKGPDEKPKRIYTKGQESIVFQGEKILYHHDGMGEGTVDINTAKKMGEKWLKKIGYSPRKMHLQIINEPNDWQLIYYDKYK